MKRNWCGYKRACLLSCSLLLLLISSSGVFAQQEHVWVLGAGTGLDFNGNPDTPGRLSLPGTLPANINEALASVCDHNGNLLFYTNGTSIYDRNHVRMPNGSNLTGPGPTQPTGPTSSSTQGALIVPMPDSAHKYFVFSLTSREAGADITGRLFYSIVNMNLNGGNGDVETQAKGVLLDSSLSEKMAGVRGTTGNYWVVVHTRDTNLFKAFEIRGAGINTTPVQTYSGYMPMYFDAGELRFSPDGTRILLTGGFSSPLGGLELFHFDGLTGRVSNPVLLDTPGNPSRRIYYSVAVSPGNTKAYAHDVESGQIYQFDLCSPVPALWATTRTPLTAAANLTKLKYGPNGYLYFYNTPRSLSRIRFPDGNVATSDLELNVVTFPVNTSHGSLPGDIPGSMQWDTSQSPGITGKQYKLTICFEDSIILNPDPGSDYIWDNGSTSRNRTVSTSGLYTVTYNGSCNSRVTDSFLVHFHSRSVPGITTTAWSCREAALDTIHLKPRTGDTTNYIYSITDTAGRLLLHQESRSGAMLTGAAPGNYRIRLQTASGCDTLILVTVAEPEDYRVLFMTDTMVCINEPLKIQHISSGLTRWEWRSGDGRLSPEWEPSFAYPTSGNYEIMLSGVTARGCRDSFSHMVTADSPGRLALSVSDREVCAGDTVYFLADHSPYGFSTLRWTYGDGDTSGGSNNRPAHLYAAPGTYAVQLTAFYRACPDASISDTVRVAAYPLVDLGSDTSLCPGERPVVLYNRADAEPGVTSYTWNTGSSSESLTVAHPGGRFILAITNSAGCVATDSIFIDRYCELGIPNAFTPDGDGHNDLFYPRKLLSRGATDFHLQIFNRWGQLLYESRGMNSPGWDGRRNGLPQPAGVYIYQIDVVFRNGLREQYQGNITLLR